MRQSDQSFFNDRQVAEDVRGLLAKVNIDIILFAAENFGGWVSFLSVNSLWHEEQTLYTPLAEPQQSSFPSRLCKISLPSGTAVPSEGMKSLQTAHTDLEADSVEM